MKPQNLITTENFNSELISFGPIKEKSTMHGKNYSSRPILYDEKKAVLKMNGVFSLYDYSGKLSLCMFVDEGKEAVKNKELLSKIEEHLSTKIIKDNRFSMKIYGKPNGKKYQVNFWELVCVNGKEYRKPMDPRELVGITFTADVVFQIDNIFRGEMNNTSVKSIITIAKEVLFREECFRKNFSSYFSDIPLCQSDTEGTDLGEEFED